MDSTSTRQCIMCMEVQIGLRVVRGPNWRWGQQDGGEGYVGTVVEVQRAGQPRDGEVNKRSPCVVTVQWDCGNRCRYRCGIEDKYDLRVIDSAPAGIKHPNVVCDGCAQEQITGIRWKCVKCSDYDLCTSCYLNGKHRFEHEFERMDTPKLRTRIPARLTTKKKEVRGIFVHAEVIPGYDWQQPQGKGALGKSGDVVGIQGAQASDNSRSFAEVLWRESQMKTVHRVGHEGKVDLKCVDPASGGYYYPDHLPVLGAPLVLPGPEDICTGDLVRVELDADIFKAMQEGHGGWSDPMLEILGETGTVQGILDTGDVRVRYSQSVLWTIGHEALVKVDVPQFRVGDMVRVLGDVTKVSELQKGHGEWGHNTVLFLGEVCRVISVLHSGDVGLSAKGRTWYFNPLCLTPADEASTAMSSTSKWYKQDTDACLQLQRLTLFEQDNPGVVVAATMASDLSMLREYLQRHPEHVNAKYDDRAALHQAAGTGNVILVKLLLEFGANVDIEDGYGHTPLHMSILSDHLETTKLLFDGNADVNAKSVEGYTPLMYAAITGRTAHAKFLLSHPKIRIHEQDIDGNTALHTAVVSRKNGVVAVLLDGGADPTLLNFSLFTPIHEAAWMGYLPAVEHFMTRFPEHSNLKNDYGCTILHIAACYNHCDIVNLAAEQRGCEIDARNDHGQTPLHIAIIQGYSKVVERLVGYGAGVNTQDMVGNTPLHTILCKEAMEAPSDDTPELKKIHEVLLGDLKSTPDNALPVVTCMTITAFFLRKGADMHIQNKKGYSALQFLPYIATLMTLLAENEDLFMDEIPPGHSGILQSVDGTDARTHLSEAIGKQSQRSYGYGSRQGHYGQSEQSLYGHGQSAYDRGRQSAYDRGGQGAYDRGGQGAYDHGGQGAYDHGGQGVYEHGGQGAHGQGSHGYSGQQSSYGYTVHLYVRNQDPYSSGGQASGSQTSHSHTGNSPYSGGSTRSASADSATGGRRWKSYYESGGQGGSYGQSASASSGYASGYDGGQDTYSYGGARASAYDPDDEEPKSKLSRPPASITPTVVPSPFKTQTRTSSIPPASGQSTAKPAGGRELCFLCDNPTDVRFRPCGHSAMCSGCAPRAKRCPTCRNPVDEIEERCISCADKWATVTRPCGHKFCTACDMKLPVCLGCSQADLD